MSESKKEEVREIILDVESFEEEGNEITLDVESVETVEKGIKDLNRTIKHLEHRGREGSNVMKNEKPGEEESGISAIVKMLEEDGITASFSSPCHLIRKMTSGVPAR